MAQNNKDDNEQKKSIRDNRSYRRLLSNINTRIGQSNLSLYGTDRTDDTEQLNKRFQEILTDELSDITSNTNGDVSSFISKLVSQDRKDTSFKDLIGNQFIPLQGDEYSTVQSFIYEAYKNRLLQQSDIHEIASQLIELSEAISITRDAICSADITEGRLNRQLKFENIDESDIKNTTPIIENMELKFDLLDKIKNFVVYNTLEYGEYYAYCIPYKEIFSNFMQAKNDQTYGRSFYGESTVFESVFPSAASSESGSKKFTKTKEFVEWANNLYDEYYIQEQTKYYKEGENPLEKVSKDDFQKDLANMLGNITVCNDPIPLSVLEEGEYSIEYFKEMVERAEEITEASNRKKNNPFNQIINTDKSNTKSSEGIHFTGNAGSEFDKGNGRKHEFDDIQDCYLKLIEPTKVVPVKVMDSVVGYYYIQTEDITPLAGAISETLYFSKFDERRKESIIVDNIAKQVVKSFDKPFLKDNLKFKKLITDCLTYYNLNEKRMKFQYIPAEYMQAFKVDKDVNGDGQSILQKSLFYAKLYLMLLLFKIMSIVLYSNDTKVNYVLQSGIDKNTANKVQEIARIRQSRQINITDLFSYTTLINKIGNGSEMYVPVGRDNRRPIETDILQGQEVQLNTELMEMLKNSYILGTGVPAAIINYMNEADFAKVIEQNNSKFNARVINYQLDLNLSITELYKKLLRWSTNLDDSVIENFKFSFEPPRTSAITMKSDVINQFQAYADFLVQLMYDDPNVDIAHSEQIVKRQREFRKLLAQDQLTMINMDEINEIFKKAELNSMVNRLTPNAENGDNGDDDGIDNELSQEIDDTPL